MKGFVAMRLLSPANLEVSWGDVRLGGVSIKEDGLVGLFAVYESKEAAQLAWPGAEIIGIEWIEGKVWDGLPIIA